MPSDWQVKIGGRVEGPFDDARIKQLVAQGRITPETLVCVAAQGRWVPARLVKGLFLSGEVARPTQAAPSVAAPPVTAPPRRRAAVPPASPPPSPSASGGPAWLPAEAVGVELPPLPPPVADAPGGFDFLGGAPAPRRPVPRRVGPSRGRRQPAGDGTLNVILGSIGAGGLVLGLFCPIIRLPIVGGVSYVRIVIQQLQGDGLNDIGVAALVAMLAAVCGVVAAVLRQRKMFWGPGVAAVIAVALTIASYMRLQSRMTADIERDLGDNPFRGFAEAMAQSVSLDFGLGLIVIGAGLLIAAAVVPEKRGSR